MRFNEYCILYEKQNAFFLSYNSLCINFISQHYYIVTTLF